MDIFKDFQTNGIINKAVRKTYIALIAKKNKCEKESNYRPISLTTTLYKLIAKVIAERFKTTLPETVFEQQMTFVKGRQITNAILISNEAVDYWRSKKSKGFIIKLDLEKAFDKIKLPCNLKKMGKSLYLQCSVFHPHQWETKRQNCSQQRS